MASGLSVTEGALIISGLSVGAGILALPVATFELGIAGATLLILALGAFNLISAMLIVEMFLKAGKPTHMPGLAMRFLGRPWDVVMIASLALFAYGAIIGYLVSGGLVISELCGGAIPPWMGTLAYFSAGTIIIWGGMWWLKQSEKSGFVIAMILVAAVMLMALPTLRLSYGMPSLAAFSMAFGVTLFACAAQEVIPSVGNSMRRDPRGFAKAVFAGMSFPILLYIVWTVVMTSAIPHDLLMKARLNGEPVTIPLGETAGKLAIFVGSLYALFATFTSFLGVAYGLADAYQDEFVQAGHRVMRRGAAVMLAVLPPLGIALLNPHGFLQALELAGFYGAGIFVGILPPLVYFGARMKGGRKPEFTVPFGIPLAVMTFCVFAFALIWKTFLLLGWI